MKMYLVLVFLVLCCAPPDGLVAESRAQGDELYFDDAREQESVHHPAWFRLSFLNLREDLEEAFSYGKRGFIVYFGQEYCPYCKALLEGNFGLREIERYTRSYFDVVAIDIHGQKMVTDLQGRTLSEKEYAQREQVNFTPTLIFYDENAEEALRLQGYYPPYQFRAALEYVADDHYREESLRDYLQRANPPLLFEPDGLNQESLFQSPPYALDRSRLKADAPLAVFFERGKCHACDVLHTAPMQNAEVRALLEHFDVVQLDTRAATPVVTPAGERTTSREWAEQLGLFYAPTLVFFDREGEEIIRVDSVVGFYRLRKVLEYVLSGAYREGITLQQFRRKDSGERS